MILDVGRDRLTAAQRATADVIVAVVRDTGLVEGAPDGLDVDEMARRAGALAALRRADMIVVADRDGADAVAAVVPVGPWDMTIDPSRAPDPDPAVAIAATHQDLGQDTGVGAGADPGTADAVTRSPARGRRPWRERRVAFVTPLPPEPTGVATYSARLASALGGRCEVVCVLAGGPVDPARRPAGTSLVTVDSFVQQAARGRFDEIVYAVGNHPLHGTQLALLRRFPGAVELHDVRLVGAYAALHAPGPALAAEVARLYPGRFPAGTLGEPELTMGPAQDAGVWLVREVAALATTVLVHSAHAAHLVRADSGVDAAMIGPLAVPAATPPTPPAEPVGGDEPLIVSVGVAHPSKRSDVLVRAVAETGAHPVDGAPAPWLALVGPVAADYRQELVQLASALGVADRVVVTGRVDDADYDRWLARAAVAVQLRASSNGESSAAVADCLARGVPTVVTDEGAQAELGDHAVVRLAPEADAPALAAVLAGLLADADRRRTMRAAALAHAAANGFDAAAARLLTALFGPDPA